MAKYKMRPLTIDAFQWSGHDEKSYYKKEGVVTKPPEIVKGHNVECRHCKNKYYRHGWLRTLAGEVIVCPGDWIVKGVVGEYYPVRPEVFEKSYLKDDKEIDVVDVVMDTGRIMNYLNKYPFEAKIEILEKIHKYILDLETA